MLCVCSVRLALMSHRLTHKLSAEQHNHCWGSGWRPTEGREGGREMKGMRWRERGGERWRDRGEREREEGEMKLVTGQQQKIRS